MDKWDDFTSRIKNSILAEEPEAAVAAAFDYLAEFGRQMERIADGIQSQAINQQIPQEPVSQVHDL